MNFRHLTDGQLHIPFVQPKCVIVSRTVSRSLINKPLSLLRDEEGDRPHAMTGGWGRTERYSNQFHLPSWRHGCPPPMRPEASRLHEDRGATSPTAPSQKASHRNQTWFQNLQMAYPLESSLQTVKTNFSEVTLTCGFNVLDTSLDKHRNWLLRSHHSCQGHPKVVTLPGRLCDGWPGFGLWFLSRREGEKSTKTKSVSTHNSNISKASRGELTVVRKLLGKKTSSRIKRLTYSSHFSKYHTRRWQVAR